MKGNRNVFFHLARILSISMGLRVSLCFLLFLLVLGQSGCDSKSRREKFLIRLSRTESEAENFARNSKSESARFLAQQTLVATAMVREQDLWSQGAGYIVFQRDDFILVRGQWISDKHYGETVVVTHNGVHVETFMLSEFDLMNNQLVPQTLDGDIGYARFEFSADVQYGSELAKHMLDGVNAQTLEFSVRHKGDEVALVKHGFVYDARD